MKLTSSTTTLSDEMVALVPALRAFARTFVREPTAADDLVQTTLVKALANLHRFQPGTRMKSWLFTIMRNAFVNDYRVARREKPGLQNCASLRSTCEPSQEWTVRASQVGRAIDRLVPEQRQAIVLVGMLGMAYEEAAEICECEIGTIKSRLSRARNRLLKDLGEPTTRGIIESDRCLAAGYIIEDRASTRTV